MSEKITSKNQLIESFEKGCKPREDWRIGTEHEKFGFQKVKISHFAVYKPVFQKVPSFI